jgi:hypothetical protein
VNRNHTDVPEGEKLPSADDPRWADWCAPLLKFLNGHARTHDELELWRRQRHYPQHLLPNMLAWLFMSGLAYFSFEGKTWRRSSRRIAKVDANTRGARCNV